MSVDDYVGRPNYRLVFLSQTIIYLHKSGKVESTVRENAHQVDRSEARSRNPGNRRRSYSDHPHMSS